MEDASFKLASLLDSLPQSVDKARTIEDISVVLSAVTPASLRTIVPNLSFNTVFEYLASCSRWVCNSPSHHHVELGQPTELLNIV